MTTEHKCPHCQEDLNKPPPPEEGSVRYWLDKCNFWNWNCNEAEIAKHLIADRITTNSHSFENFKKAFTQFFSVDQDHRTHKTLEVIEHILQTFGDG